MHTVELRALAEGVVRERRLGRGREVGGRVHVLPAARPAELIVGAGVVRTRAGHAARREVTKGLGRSSGGDRCASLVQGDDRVGAPDAARAAELGGVLCHHQVSPRGALAGEGAEPAQQLRDPVEVGGERRHLFLTVPERARHHLGDEVFGGRRRARRQPASLRPARCPPPRRVRGTDRRAGRRRRAPGNRSRPAVRRARRSGSSRRRTGTPPPATSRSPSLRCSPTTGRLAQASRSDPRLDRRPAGTTPPLSRRSPARR